MRRDARETWFHERQGEQHLEGQQPERRSREIPPFRLLEVSMEAEGIRMDTDSDMLDIHFSVFFLFPSPRMEVD